MHYKVETVAAIATTVQVLRRKRRCHEKLQPVTKKFFFI